jgi:hypothetical protein
MEKAKVCRRVWESWPRVATPIMGGSGFHRNSSSKNLALDFLEPQHKHPHPPPELPRFFQTTSSKGKFRSAAQTPLRGKKKSAVACTTHKMFSIHKKMLGAMKPLLLWNSRSASCSCSCSCFSSASSCSYSDFFFFFCFHKTEIVHRE